MKRSFLGILVLLCLRSAGQELYVYAEPASNMPAHSLSIKLTDHFITNDKVYNRVSHRFMPQLMFGISKKFMFHLGTTFSNMHTPDFRYESVNLYAKYRFFSKDDIHQHFRMAVFADASVTKAPFHYEEISLMGDKSGIEAGVIATQLWHKFAVSGTLSHTQVLDRSRYDKVFYVPPRIYQSLNYALSMGYLVLPKEYTDYRQTNLNLYLEVLGEQSLDINRSFLDLAPAIQLIFHSNAKLNLGHRFQLSGNMRRMSLNSWQLSFERTFLGALGSRRK